jgi:phosphate:Na+ symporter
MDTSAAITLLGGLGLFLLGIHHLTEGLKGLAGDSLRRALQRLVAGRFSAVASGALFTAVIQSSTAAILTVIGFVNAGLVTFSQAVGMIIGATLGTTSTIWLVAIFGLRFRISAAALPMLGIGAFLWLIARGKTRSFGALLAGFGLIFTGIDFLQTGMGSVSWNLEAFAGRGFGARWILAGIGVLMSIVMQSSTAAGAATLVALNAGSLTFDQGCAMIVGQSVGTAATTGLVMVGGGLAVRRSALAHIIFSVIVGVLGILLLGPLTAAAGWLGSRLYDPDGVLAMATFSSLFKLAGILVFYPWLDHFSRFIVRISGTGSESAVSRLDPTLVEAGGEVALEAAWRATLEVAHAAVDAIRRRLAGEPVTYDPPAESVQQIEHFLESLPLETTDLGTIGPRLVRLVHALDHLTELHDDLTRIPSGVSGWQPPAGFAAGAQALATWFDATRDPETSPDPAVFKAIEDASKQLSAERKTDREKLLEDVALQRMPTATARAGLDTLVWADLALYHAWRLAESLRIASGK